MKTTLAAMAALACAGGAYALESLITLATWEPERSTRVAHVRVVDDGPVRCYVLDKRRGGGISCVVLP